MGDIDNVINATNTFLGDVEGIELEMLTDEEEMTFDMNVMSALEIISETDDQEVKYECLDSLSDYLMDFTVKINRSRILVDLPDLAKQIILKSAKVKESRKVEVILLTDEKLIYESDIMKMYPEDFFFDSKEYQTSNISKATLNLTRIYNRFTGLSSAFDSIGREAAALIQEGTIESADQINKFMWYMDIALREGIIAKGYEDFVTELLKNGRLKYFQATGVFPLCLSPNLYEKIELSESEQNLLQNLLSLRMNREASREYNAQQAAKEILDWARRVHTDILIVDVPEIYETLPNDKEIRVAIYDHSKFGKIYDKDGRSITKASLILSMLEYN